MTVLAIIRDLNLADAWLAAGAVRNFIWNQLWKTRVWRDNRYGSGPLWPEISWGDSARSSRTKEDLSPVRLGSEKSSLYAPHGQGRLLIAVPVMRFQIPRTVYGSCGSLKERRSTRALSPLWDKGYRRLHRSVDSAFLVSPERLAVYTNGWKENWQSKWPPLGFVFQNRETDQIWKGIWFFLKWWSPFGHLSVILL